MVLPGARAQVIGLHIAQRVAVGIGIETLPRAVTREMPGAGFIAHVDREHVEQVLDMAGVFDPYERLDAAVEVTVHHIGRPDIDDGSPAFSNAKMRECSQEAPKYRTHPDILAEARHTGAQGANTAHDHIDGNSRL